MLDGSVNTSVIKERHSTWIISGRKYKSECMCVWLTEFIQVCMWSSKRPSVCVWSVYAFPCVYAWTRLVISDKGHGEWQGGQPAGVCQWTHRVNSGLSDRDFSWHTGHSCSWKSSCKVAGCGSTTETVAAMWPVSLLWSYSDYRPPYTTGGWYRTWNIVQPG